MRNVRRGPSQMACNRPAVLALLFFLCMASALPSPSQEQQPSFLSDYHVVFSDDFRHLDLSPDGEGAHTWYEGIWFSHKHAPLSNIRSGPDGLHLTWTRGQEQPDTSISTFSRKAKNVHAWRYGYFEVRMKWTPQRGAWPAVWLIPSVAGHLNESGEMDVFEGNGDHPREIYGTIHHWVEGHSRTSPMLDRENTGRSNRFSLPSHFDPAVYHVYAMLWTPDRISWYVDGAKLHEERAYSVFDRQDYCLVIGMQEGADWKPGNLDRVTAERLNLDVDWVRVWQKNE